MGKGGPIVVRIDLTRSRVWLLCARACCALRWLDGVEYCVNRAAAAVRTTVKN